MPPSSDRRNQEPLFNLDPDLQRGTRKRSPGRKKGKRKNEPIEEISERTTDFGDLQNEVTSSPSSILAQLHKSTVSPFQDRSKWKPPSYEIWDHRPAEYEDAKDEEEEPLDWPTTIPQDQSPPDIPDRAATPPAPVSPRYHGGQDVMRQAFNTASPPASPPNTYRQLVHPRGSYQGSGHDRGLSPSGRRPLSAHLLVAPPPHQPQAHFYGAPELDFGLSRNSSRLGGNREPTFCAFDSIPSLGIDNRPGTEDVLLVGFDNGLDVYRLDRKHFDHIGSLTGLRGSVLQAKMLSSTDKSHTLTDMFPMIAMIIHGPPIQAEEPVAGGPDAPQAVIHEATGREHDSFETTVEIYSIRTGAHMQTLFHCPKNDLDGRSPTGTSRKPVSTADLSISTEGNFLVLSSGKSGETYIFEYSSENEAAAINPFRCLGKIWTKTAAKTYRMPPSSHSDLDPLLLQDGFPPEIQMPSAALLSLSSRWLAYLPPASSAQMSIHGTVIDDVPASKLPGVSSHASPSEPAVTCQLDTPDAETFLNKVARDSAQTLMKGAQWVSTQGMQAWNSYWSKPPEQGTTRYSSSYPHTGPLASPHMFPPTHAQDPKPNSGRVETTLVSILDLERLSNSQSVKHTIALEPAATFALSNGCSLLSFAPDGLKLMTASAKGDVQQVWDLMRMVHGGAVEEKDPNSETTGPTVREIARYTRMTEARIVDVVWTKPKGSRFALITDRGTVHIYDMPSSAFQWPPTRKSARYSNPSTDPPDISGQDEPVQTPPNTGGAISSAFGMLSSTTQPIFAAVRGRRTSAGSSFPGFGGFATTAGFGAKGGKAVAAGVNRSVSAAAIGTYNTIRHLGENRIALPSSPSGIAPGCARWMTGKEQGALAVTGGGVVKIYSIRRSDNPRAGNRRPSVLGDRPAEFAIPQTNATDRPHNHRRSSSQQQQQQLQIQQGHQQRVPAGNFWRFSQPKPNSQPVKANLHPLSFAEIDTSAAYQPFHTDRRVDLFVYSEDPTLTLDGRKQKGRSDGGSRDEKTGAETWLFGENIPVTKISSGSSSGNGEDEVDDSRGTENVLEPEKGSDEEWKPRAQMEDVSTLAEDVRTKMEHTELAPSPGGEGAGDADHGQSQPQQILLTTTTKRKKKGRKTVDAAAVSSLATTPDAEILRPTSPPKDVGGGSRSRGGPRTEIFEDDCEVVDFGIQGGNDGKQQ